MPEAMDPTFYRSPAAAIAAPPERLAYVVAFDPTGVERDAMTVLDCDADSSTYGEVVGWTDLPTGGNELHHFGWNACSSALCHEGHGHDGALERRYLIAPGVRSSRTYVLDTKPDPRRPQVVRTIEAEELAAKDGYSRPHTVHCGPGGIFMSNLGGADGAEGPGGVALIDQTPSRSPGRGRATAASSTSGTTSRGTSTTTSRLRRSGRHRRWSSPA